MAHGSIDVAEETFRHLCHVLSLTRTGKVDGAIEGLVLGVLCIDRRVGASPDPNELATAISTYFNVEIHVGAIREAIEHLLRDGRLQINRTTDPSSIEPSLSERTAVQRRTDEASALEEQVKAQWLAEVAVKAPDLDVECIWRILRSYLAAAFQRHGVDTVQLLDSEAREPGNRNDTGLSQVLGDCMKAEGVGKKNERVRDLIHSFFEDPPKSRLTYLSQLLDGTFTFYALTISDATAQYLKEQMPRVRLFLDTNVALGLLGFQNNPLQEATTELIAFIRENDLPISLHYHERTLRELQALADSARSRLSNHQFTPALSRAYVQAFESSRSDSGIDLHFHRLNADGGIDPEIYLARFDHLEDLLRDKGAALYRQEWQPETHDKGQLIAEFMEFIETARPDHKRPYAAVDHDIAVWLGLQHIRSRARSALRTGALLLSHDYAFFAFDRRHLMKRGDSASVPTVVQPQQLLQLLRPFARVSENYDEKFILAFAAPEFRTAQSDYDKTRTRVIETLASFKGVEASTAIRIISDDLLVREAKDATEDELVDLVESTVFGDNARLAEEKADLELDLSKSKLESQALRDEQALLSTATREAKRRATAAEQRATRAEERERVALEAERAVGSEAVQVKETSSDLQEQVRRQESELETAHGEIRLLKSVVAGLLMVVGAASLIALPQLAVWGWYNNLERPVGFSLGAAAIWCAGVYCLLGYRHRVVVGWSIIVGILVTMIFSY